MTTFTCRGPLQGVFTEDDAKAGLCKAEQIGHGKRGVMKKNKAVAGRITQGDDGPEVHPADDEASESLVACGYGLDDLIAAVPVDGQEYEVECPSCGNVIKVRHEPEAESDE